MFLRRKVINLSWKVLKNDFFQSPRIVIRGLLKKIERKLWEKLTNSSWKLLKFFFSRKNPAQNPAENTNRKYFTRKNFLFFGFPAQNPAHKIFFLLESCSLNFTFRFSCWNPALENWNPVVKNIFLLESCCQTFTFLFSCSKFCSLNNFPAVEFYFSIFLLISCSRKIKKYFSCSKSCWWNIIKWKII